MALTSLLFPSLIITGVRSRLAGSLSNAHTNQSHASFNTQPWQPPASAIALSIIYYLLSTAFAPGSLLIWKTHFFSFSRQLLQWHLFQFWNFKETSVRCLHVVGIFVMMVSFVFCVFVSMQLFVCLLLDELSLFMQRFTLSPNFLSSLPHKSSCCRHIGLVSGIGFHWYMLVF